MFRKKKRAPGNIRTIPAFFALHMETPEITVQSYAHALNDHDIEEVIGHFDYGKVAWILDPEGNKIESSEPMDQILEDWEEAHNQ